MSGKTIAQINKIWREAYKHQEKRKRLYDCPFIPMDYSSTTGMLKKKRVECSYGKGNWCAICSKHTRWQKQRGSSKEVYFNKKRHVLESYNKTGLVPSLRRKPDPIKVVDPLGGYL